MRCAEPAIPQEIAAWCGGRVCGVGAVGEKVWLEIDTLEGTMKANYGDYVIKGVKGEFYPCKPDIFSATYDPVEARSPVNTCADLSEGVPARPTTMQEAICAGDTECVPSHGRAMDTLDKLVKVAEWAQKHADTNKPLTATAELTRMQEETYQNLHAAHVDSDHSASVIPYGRPAEDNPDTLGGLREHVDTITLAFSDLVGKVEDRVTSLAESLEGLVKRVAASRERDNRVQELSDEMAGLGNSSLIRDIHRRLDEVNARLAALELRPATAPFYPWYPWTPPQGPSVTWQTYGTGSPPGPIVTCGSK
jgi:hypothetical protein